MGKKTEKHADDEQQMHHVKSREHSVVRHLRQADQLSGSLGSALGVGLSTMSFSALLCCVCMVPATSTSVIVPGDSRCSTEAFIVAEQG